MDGEGGTTAPVHPGVFASQVWGLDPSLPGSLEAPMPTWLTTLGCLCARGQALLGSSFGKTEVKLSSSVTPVEGQGAEQH